MQSPQLYATFLLWLLSELYERMPEVGDAEKPKLVFFFDEAHLLFNDLPSALGARIEQVVRLIRSKGIGVYFVTQNPNDVSQVVLSQLGNRVQHALRAFTPNDQKAVKSAADTFRTNPKLDTATVITQLAVGEALVSFLMRAARPASSSARWSARQPARSAPSRPSGGSRSSPPRPSQASTKKSWIATPPTSASPTKHSRPPARARYSSANKCRRRHRPRCSRTRPPAALPEQQAAS